jgi:hypothetical protein
MMINDSSSGEEAIPTTHVLLAKTNTIDFSDVNTTMLNKKASPSQWLGDKHLVRILFYVFLLFFSLCVTASVLGGT